MRETSLTCAAGGPAVPTILALLSAPVGRADSHAPVSLLWLLGEQTAFVAQWYPYVPGPYSNYMVGLGRYHQLTADLQGVTNPGTNSARGPTVVFGIRLHAHL